MDITWQRSSFCANMQCVEVAWVKSSASLGNGTCVEVAEVEEQILVRDSKNPDGPVLSYTRAEWAAFLEGARNGEFDF